MNTLPYTYTDDAGDTLTITAGPGARIVVKMSIPDDDEQGVTEHVASVVGPKGEDAAHLAHVLLTVGEMGDHMVIARAQVDRLIRAEAVKVAQSMRERVAHAVAEHGEGASPSELYSIATALPLFSEGDNT